MWQNKKNMKWLAKMIRLAQLQLYPIQQYQRGKPKEWKIVGVFQTLVWLQIQTKPKRF